MRVVRLRKKLDHAGHTAWFPEKDEAQAHDCYSSHIIANIADGNVQEPPNSFVASSTAVCQRNGHNATIAQCRVWIIEETINKLVCSFLTRVHDERHAHG